MATRLLSIKDAAAETGLSIWTLRDLIAAGDLPVIRPPKMRRVWIDRKDLERALDTWREHGTAGEVRCERGEKGRFISGDNAGTHDEPKAH